MPRTAVAAALIATLADPRAELLGEWYAKSVETGPRHSITVRGRFARVCCGWRMPPTPAELYDAIRAGAPEPRHRAVYDSSGFGIR